jgi:hypothetical protein
MRLTLSLMLLAASPAYAGLVGTSVEFDFASPGCSLSATVVDPGVEFVNTGPGLCMAGPSGRQNADVFNDRVRIDFTAEQDFGFGGVAATMFAFRNLNPVCPDGSIGEVTGLGAVTTNMETDEWIPSQIAFSAHEVRIIGNPTALGGDDPNNVRTHPGDFIDVELEFSCGPTLTLGGVCPTAVTVSAANMTPFGTVAVVRSTAPGSFTVPSGACAGTNLGLSPVGIGLLTTVTANASGQVNWSGSVGPGMCTKWFQFVDMSTCTPTNIDQF